MSSNPALNDIAPWDAIVHNVPGQYLWHHGSWFAGIGVAPSVVEYLREHHICILRFEGFTADGRSVKQLTNVLADFPVSGTWLEQVNGSADACLTLLALLENDPVFLEFVVAYAEDARSSPSEKNAT